MLIFDNYSKILKCLDLKAGLTKETGSYLVRLSCEMATLHLLHNNISLFDWDAC